MPRVDVNVPRFNQAVVAVATAGAFVANAPWLVAVVFLVLAASAVGGSRFAPLTRLYTGIVRPRLRPANPVVTEPAAPPRFAQLLGTIVLGSATAAFIAGAAVAGWVLTLVVTSLASIAVLADVCVGCLLYSRLSP